MQDNRGSLSCQVLVYIYFLLLYHSSGHSRPLRKGCIYGKVQELCHSWGGRPGLSILMSLLVSVDVKQHWTVLWHWSQFVPNMSTDIWGHEAPLHLYVWLVVKAAKKLPHNWSWPLSARIDAWECRICGHACSRWSTVLWQYRQACLSTPLITQTNKYLHQKCLVFSDMPGNLDM